MKILENTHKKKKFLLNQKKPHAECDSALLYIWGGQAMENTKPH